jgi:hypothetical protein
VLELDAVFVACSSGELLLLHTASRAVEEVGVVQGGVAAAGWSPDGELLVLLGYNQGLLMMNKVGFGAEVVLGYNQDLQQLLHAFMLFCPSCKQARAVAQASVGCLPGVCCSALCILAPDTTAVHVSLLQEWDVLYCMYCICTI